MTHGIRSPVIRGACGPIVARPPPPFRKVYSASGQAITFIDEDVSYQHRVSVGIYQLVLTDIPTATCSVTGAVQTQIYSWVQGRTPVSMDIVMTPYLIYRLQNSLPYVDGNGTRPGYYTYFAFYATSPVMLTGTYPSGSSTPFYVGATIDWTCNVNYDILVSE